MADRFTADKMAWLERVQDHPGLPQTAFSVAFALSRHMNRASGDAWPSQATIGAMAGVKARQVRNLIRALADAGLVAGLGLMGAVARRRNTKRKH